MGVYTVLRDFQNPVNPKLNRLPTHMTPWKSCVKPGKPVEGDLVSPARPVLHASLIHLAQVRLNSLDDGEMVCLLPHETLLGLLAMRLFFSVHPANSNPPRHM